MPQKTYMYDTQWNQLINAIGTGDSSAVVTAISNIKTSIDNIYTRLNAVGFNSTQWDNLVDSINNQIITVDFSNINSNNVSNLSNIIGTTLTDALNSLKSILTDFLTFRSVTSTVLTAFGRKTSVTAPTIPGYKFLTWTHAVTVGWVGNLYFETPLNDTSNVWTANYGSTSQGTGNIICHALYVKNIS